MVLVLGAVGCSVIVSRELLERYGPEHVQQRIVPAERLSKASVNYWKEVKPILDRRCAVCHSCYDAPCQLKLTTPQGIDRGATKAIVYDPERLFAQDPTRLFIDASSTAEWRKKNFYPVLNERIQTPEANLAASVLYRMLDLKRKHPLPTNATLLSGFDLSFDPSPICPRIEEMPSFEREYPLWGMPYGLPAISDKEFSTIERWLKQGALVAEPPPLQEGLKAALLEWEHFLNGDSLKARLMSRYLYEHLFLGDLFFEDIDNSRHFKLVRSRTPPGEPISVIASVRPTDDPRVDRPYYRLALEPETTVEKTLNPYALHNRRLARFRELFLEQHYVVAKLPGYSPDTAANPFKIFASIPVETRYRFLLDDAHFFVNGFIKGPVCQGRVALSVIDDRFWVFFQNPDQSNLLLDDAFLAREVDSLSLPAEAGSTTSGIVNWRRYASAQKRLLSTKRELGSEWAKRTGKRPGLTSLWNGDGKNTSAALTIFRHYDSASVVRGLVGGPPKTAWVLGYPLLERIHYLLVAGFDVYGNVGHQLLTRLYMDFLRVEAENNFLLLLPLQSRKAEHDHWYRGIGSDANEYTISPENYEWVDSGIQYTSAEPKQELFELIKRSLGYALEHKFALSDSEPEAIKNISQLRGSRTALLPEISMIRVKRRNGMDQAYTLLFNRAYSNVATLYLESWRLLPEENDVTIVPGFIGAYPDVFFVVEESDLDNFATALAALNNEESYRAFVDRYGVRRTNPEFWNETDWFQDAFLEIHGAKSGILDFSRLENR